MFYVRIKSAGVLELPARGFMKECRSDNGNEGVHTYSLCFDVCMQFKVEVHKIVEVQLTFS
jgi:hypothetical protein